MEEIKATLRKYDIAASVVLSSPTHLEYLRELQTSWNALAIEQTPEGTLVRFRCRREDYPTEAAWQEAMRLSMGTILGFVDVLRSESDTYKLVVKHFIGKMEVSHFTRDEGPHS